MRKIYYIPKGESVESHKDEWHLKTNEVHTGLSPNIEKYIDNPDVPQFVDIPEFKHIISPKNQAKNEYFQVGYVDDFADRSELPQYTCEVWKKNLDRPSEPHEKIHTWFLQFNGELFHTDHVALDIGWYDLVIKCDGEEVDTSEISIYYLDEEE